MTPKKAYDALSNKVNIEFYVGPHVAKVIKDTLCNEPKPEKVVKKAAVKKVVKSKESKD